MKTIKHLVLSILFITHFSCSSDDDKVNPIDIVGIWTMTEGFIEPSSMVLDLGNGLSFPVEVSGDFINIDPDNHLTFKDDKTFSSYTGNLSLEMTMIIMGTSETNSFEMEDTFGDGTWEVNGQELKIHNENGTTIKYKIDKLTNDTLELSANVQDIALESGSNPMLDSMNIIVKMKFKRI